MNKLAIITIAIMAFPFLVKGQTYTENFIKNTSYQNEYSWTEVDNGEVPLDDKIETITYFDGLRRPIQNIAQRAGGDRENLIVPSFYDVFGRQTKQYLPLAVDLAGGNENGEMHIPTPAGIHDDINTFYRAKFPDDFYQGAGLIPDYDNAYSQQVLESSPLNRVLEQGAPGFDWHATYSDHTIKFGYQTNTTAGEVRHFSVAFGNNGTDYTDPSLVFEGHYNVNELFKNVTKDENWLPSDGNKHTSQEFTNKKGQMVLSRKFDDNDNLIDTYYVYDDDGNLTYVISPEGSHKILVNGVIQSQIIEGLCYQYKYDSRGRIFEKKEPGTGLSSIIYDKLDRPVFTQDAEQAKNNEWLFTKYDALGRIAYTGILKNHTKASIIAGLDTNGIELWDNQKSSGPETINGTVVYYSNDAFPNVPADMQIHTVSYYDTYIDQGTIGSPPVQNFYNDSITTRTQGLPTVSKVRVLDGHNDPNPSQNWITTVTGYDKKARPIYVMTENPYLNTEDKVETLLDFTGKPIESRTQHEIVGINANTIVTLDYFTYDHIGRLLTHEQKIDNEPVELIAKNYYDELGQHYKKDVGGETFIDGYTDITNADVSFDGTMSRNTSGDNWTSGLKTKGEILDDGGISFTLNQTDKRIRAGLEKTGSSFLGGWSSFDYAIEAKVGGAIDIIVSGSVQTTSETYIVGDSFSVERIGDDILYKKNGGTPFHTYTETNGTSMIGKVSFYTAYGEVENFTLFGNAVDKVLQEVDYRYNIRGWLTAINDVEEDGKYDTDLFKFRINYNEAIEGASSGQGVVPLFNGNISQTVWKTKNVDDIKRSYGYTFDALNRLTKADSRKNAGLNTQDRHSLDRVSYDRNGNIKNLDRYGHHDNLQPTDPGIWWDKLIYKYDNGGNRLTEVQDLTTNYAKDEGFNDDGIIGDDYTYDDNGNMISDTNKGITNTTYNHLQLPEVVTVGGAQSGTIVYIYDAIGTKLKKTVNKNGTSHTTIYAGNYMYLDDELQFFQHLEGYVEPVAGTSESVRESLGGQTTQSGYSYVFQYLDHLGNVRLSYSDSDLNGAISTSEIIEESHYYPFGLKQKGYNEVVQGGNDLAQNWKYNGIELNESLGIDIYEMELRQYDPAIGRWTGMDPVTHHSFSPYNAFDNNPVYWADPSGADGVPGPGASKALPREVQRAYDTGSTIGLGSSFSMDLGGMPANGGGNPNSDPAKEDDLYISKNEKTKEYLLSMVKERNQKYLLINDETGEVTLDFTGVSEQKIKKILKRDKGLASIKRLVDAKDKTGVSQKFYFEVGFVLKGVFRSNNEPFVKSQFGLSGTTVEGRDVIKSGENWSINRLEAPLPPDGYDGAIFVHPGRAYRYSSITRELRLVSRTSYLIHEFNESFYMTNEELPYPKAHLKADGLSINRYIFD